MLGASMLLDGREDADQDNPFVSPDAFADKGSQPPEGLNSLGPKNDAAFSSARDTPKRPLWLRDLLWRTLPRAARVVPMGLIGFGLAGLTAKGLELDLWPWTFVGALLVGASLIGLGYRLSRPRMA